MMSIGLYSCEAETAEPQLSEEKLVNTLADIHIAEAALQALRGKTKDSISQAYYEQIYSIHGVDSALVQTSLEAIRRQPEQMKDLYDQVMERVEKLNALAKDPEDKE
jgi:predicted GNAT family acetyltransferase